MSAEWLLLLIPISAAVIGGLVGHWLHKRQQVVYIWGLLAAMAVIAWHLWSQMEAARGWDALGYMLGLLGILAPVALGFVLGVGLAWLRNRRA